MSSASTCCDPARGDEPVIALFASMSCLPLERLILSGHDDDAGHAIGKRSATCVAGRVIGVPADVLALVLAMRTAVAALTPLVVAGRACWSPSACS